MEHVEYMWLLEEAHFLWEHSLAAEADGDEFFPCETSTPLKSGPSARARITRPVLENPPVLVLVLKGCDNARADLEARAFFEKEFSKAGVTPKGEHVFVSSYVPPRLRPQAVGDIDDKRADRCNGDSGDGDPSRASE